MSIVFDSMFLVKLAKIVLLILVTIIITLWPFKLYFPIINKRVCHHTLNFTGPFLNDITTYFFDDTAFL